MSNKIYKLGMRAVHQKDLPTAISEAKENGFEVLEIHLSSPQFLPQNYSAGQLIKIKDFSAKNNITLQTHSEIGQSLIQADSILRTAEKQKLKEIIQFSRNIGARCLTLHVGDAPGYSLGTGKRVSNDVLYAKYYSKLFEDSIKYIVSIAPKGMLICIENDNLLPAYQKVLGKYLKTGKVFLTWDIMKSGPEQQRFVKKNLRYVKNLHISGPHHAGLKGYERDYLEFFKLFQGKDIPMIVEIISLENALETKALIRSLGF